jgi:hypothetical protein
MGFEVFNKRAAGISKHPYVTMQRKGPFSFNQAAFELMGSPEAVELLYDKDKERVGFRSVAPDRPQAFPVRAQGKNSVTHIVAGQSFAKHYGLDASVARRYPVAMEDDILVVDLRGDSVDVTGPRAKKPSADRSDEGGE